MDSTGLSYRRAEIAADRVVHIAGIAFGLAASIALAVLVAIRGGALNIIAAGIYSAGLLLMLVFSAAYNLTPRGERREMLRRFDRAAIFVMIAGTYTPFTLVRLEGMWSSVVTAIIWSVAAAGVALAFLQPRRFEAVFIGLYLMLGWAPMAVITLLLPSLGLWTLGLLVTGGVFYSLGVVFHVWNALSYNNVFWHGFVLAGACVHYAAVLIALGVS